MSKVIIFGIGKLAELAHFYLTHDSKHEVIAFSVDKDFIKEDKFRGLPVVPFEEISKHYPPADYQMLIAVGYTKLNSVRTAKYAEAKNKGYTCISYVCSKSVIWEDLNIGDNCIIFENQVIQPSVKIGNNVILWSGNHLGHDVIIGDNTFIASHVVLSGGVNIGSRCFIGINASIRDNVKIGDESIIGAGAVVLHDVKEKSVLITKQTPLYSLDSEDFEKMMDISK